MVSKSSAITGGVEVATLAGGCFWCLEAVYNTVQGVKQVVSGYSGGRMKFPSYTLVSTGTTGHAEVVQVTFDPRVITYREILDLFFSIHDPTTLNRQGADVGTQYRSAIFYHSAEQKAAAESLIRELEEKQVWSRPIVTEITPFEVFYPAEDYHQNYYKRNSGEGYCRVVIAPKLNKVRTKFQQKLRV